MVPTTTIFRLLIPNQNTHAKEPPQVFEKNFFLLLNRHSSSARKKRKTWFAINSALINIVASSADTGANATQGVWTTASEMEKPAAEKAEHHEDTHLRRWCWWNGWFMRDPGDDNPLVIAIVCAKFLIIRFEIARSQLSLRRIRSWHSKNSSWRPRRRQKYCSWRCLGYWGRWLIDLGEQT